MPDTSKSLTKQDAFNVVYTHFVHQKGLPSVDPESNRCVYRGPNGTKCAFGLLISDESYKPTMEYRSAWSIIVDFLSNREDLIALREFIVTLQRAHDVSAVKYDYELCGQVAHPVEKFHSSIKENLEQIAEENDLSIPEAPK